ncbi:hypothetical protein Hanom_Chr00s000004g01610181 [Helianthus anomalus]
MLSRFKKLNYSGGLTATSVLPPLSATASSLSVAEDGRETSALLGGSVAISSDGLTSGTPLGRLSVAA